MVNYFRIWVVYYFGFGWSISVDYTLLKNSIPEFPVNNKTLYSILSKGIHELSEEECLDIFPVLKTAIEYILDEIKAKKELEEKKRILSEQIGKINSNIGSEK